MRQEGLARSTATSACRPQLPQQAAPQAVSQVGVLRVRNKRCNTGVAPAGESGNSCGAAGAQRHKTQQTARKHGSSTRHEGGTGGANSKAAAGAAAGAGVLRRADAARQPAAQQRPAAARVSAGSGGYAKRSMRTDTTRPPIVVLFIVFTASSAASLVGKRTMPKPLHREQRGRAGQGRDECAWAAMGGSGHAQGGSLPSAADACKQQDRTQTASGHRCRSAVHAAAAERSCGGARGSGQAACIWWQPMSKPSPLSCSKQAAWGLTASGRASQTPHPPAQSRRKR